VRREVERAVSRQLRILPFRIDDVPPSKSLEYFLSTQHWLDAFPPPREPHYARLCATLELIVGAPGRAALPAQPAAVAPDRGHVAGAVTVLDAACLGQVAAQLAEHVGPVAKVLVHRAAPGAASVEELARLLATEIGAEGARRAFVASCERIGTGRR
jgi:hypothetical protein